MELSLLYGGDVSERLDTLEKVCSNLDRLCLILVPVFALFLKSRSF